MGLERFARPTHGLRTRYDPVSPQTLRSHPLESNQILRTFKPARRPLTQGWEMGCRDTPCRRRSIVKDRVSTAGAAHPGQFKARVSRTPQFRNLLSSCSPDSRAHVSRRGGSSAPEKTKAARGCPGAAWLGLSIDHHIAAPLIGSCSGLSFQVQPPTENEALATRRRQSSRRG